jgi:hypothetical protein
VASVSAWSFLALEAEIPNPGDFKSTFVGDTPVVVTRTEDNDLAAWVNRSPTCGVSHRYILRALLFVVLASADQVQIGGGCHKISPDHRSPSWRAGGLRNRTGRGAGAGPSGPTSQEIADADVEAI